MPIFRFKYESLLKQESITRIMGCDFNLLIQVQYGSFWVTIVEFGTKTSCGGYPLCNAMREVAKSRGALGGYGLQFPTLSKNVDVVSYIISKIAKSKEDENIEKLSINSDIKEKEEGIKKIEKVEGDVEGEHGEDEDDETCEARYELEFLYYSKEQFQELIECIEPISELRGDPRVYNKCMEPIPMWCEMALTSAPVEGCGWYRNEIWMSAEPDKIQSTTDAIIEGQEKLKSLWRDNVTTVGAQSRLPAELLHMIADYSVGGVDVRVAFKDDEGQSGMIRKGDFSEPKGCCVM